MDVKDIVPEIADTPLNKRVCYIIRPELRRMQVEFYVTKTGRDQYSVTVFDLVPQKTTYEPIPGHEPVKQHRTGGRTKKGLADVERYLKHVFRHGRLPPVRR